MPLEKIIERILRDGRSQADAILSVGREEAEKILAHGRKQAANRKQEMIRSAKTRLTTEKERKIALARLEARKQSLQARCELIDLVFSRTLQTISDLKPDEHRQLFQNLIGDFVPSEPCEIIVHAPEQDKYTLLLSSLWQTAFTRFCQMNAVEESIGGGIIIRTSLMEYDCTFKRLVEENRKSLERKVIEYLFPKQEKVPSDNRKES